ncbi:MAG: hypothetical protein SFU83_22170 [Meiothermus sp.]|nr:hypothetical protein [Meiothermus sp.]
MAHHISGAIFNGTLEPSILERFDLSWQALPQGFYLLYFSGCYCEHWAAHLGLGGELELPPGIPPKDHYLLPHDRVIAHILREVSGQAEPLYALLVTDYFGGLGEQYAALYQGEQLRPLEDTWINTALRALGVQREADSDEFDTVHLGNFRSLPEALSFYRDGEEEAAWVSSPKHAKVAHIVWEKPWKEEFLEAAWYDKPTPYKQCLARLEALRARSLEQSFLITSFGKRHHITSPGVFRRWVKEVFEGGLAYGFSSRLFADHP